MKAHIFDMDGLLIDSEPFWRLAEIKIFTQLGIDFNDDMCRETVGMRIDEVVKYWNQKLSLEMPIPKTANDIQDELISLVNQKGKALVGVYEAIETLKQNNKRIALASSSSMNIINAVVKKLNIKNYFEVLHSAEFELKGKPHPDVFLSTAKMLNVAPQECVVYEDSKNGMRAGIAAGMRTVLIPEFPEPKMDWHQEAFCVWKSLEEFEMF